MTEVMKKVLITQNLRKDPLRQSDMLTSPVGEVLQVHAGEKVNTGAKPAQDEVFEGGKITWVFVEATDGLFVDLRKGFVSDSVLVSMDVPVDQSPGFQAFLEQVDRRSFANACYLQAILSKTNPAYLYALAFALSGDQWSTTQVMTKDAAGADALGVFRFPKATWQSLLSEPEASGLQPDQIKFPNAQCIVAAIVAARSADLLQGLITDRALNAIDLFLAHLFADDISFGSNAAGRIRQAEMDNKGQPCAAVVEAEIYPDNADRDAFFKRNADVFKADGSATIEEALKNCEGKLNAGFDEVRKLIDELGTGDDAKDLDDCPGSLLENGIPSDPTGPILGGGSDGTGPAGPGAGGGGSDGTGPAGPGAGGGGSDGTGPAGTSVGGEITEATKNATRNLPITQALRDILEYAGRKTGVDVIVYSGGQPATGSHRTGTHRHDVVPPGVMGAADLHMLDPMSKRILDSDNKADRARMAAFMEEAAAAGAIGIGHAPGYMGTKSTHIGGGKPEAVWGAGNSRAGAPAWVIEAFEHGRARALAPQKFAAALKNLRNSPPPTQGQGQTSTDTGGTLASIRKRFAQELQDPNIHRLLAASTGAEVGGQGQKAEQYYLESVFNRATARDKSLEETVTDTKYYPSSTINKLGNAIASAVQARIDKVIQGVMAGANESNLATGNESGAVHSGGAPVTRDLGPGKERFVQEIPDTRWVRTVQAALVRGDATV